MGAERNDPKSARALGAIVAVLCALSAPALAEEAAEGEEPAAELTLIRASTATPGVDVTIDGHPCGQTPALVEVAPGPHEVALGMAGGRVVSTVVAVEGETVEVRVEGGPAPAAPVEPVRPPPGPPVAQSRDGEVVDDGPEGEEEEPPEEEPVGPWHRRVPQYPWFEISFVTGAFWRDFRVPIDQDIDREARAAATLVTAGVGEALVGGRLNLFPFASARTVPLRGLGLEAAVATVAGMELASAYAPSIDSSYYEADVGGIYRLVFGSQDVGADLDIRFGWHRTEFDVADVGNDLVPPYTYDTIRFGVGLRVPLGTRHLSVVLSAGYLLVAGIGSEAEIAYNASGETADANGGEVGVGVVARLGGLELGLRWSGRWLVSTNHGLGEGYGLDPSTIYGMERDAQGIMTTDDGVDSYNMVQITLGYRYRARPGRARLSPSTRREPAGVRDRW